VIRCLLCLKDSAKKFHFEVDMTAPFMIAWYDKNGELKHSFSQGYRSAADVLQGLRRSPTFAEGAVFHCVAVASGPLCVCPVDQPTLFDEIDNQLLSL